DITFGSTKKSLRTEFEGLIHKKFQMSSMGELTFFLGLQVMQRHDGIFISQDKFQVTLKVSHLHAMKRIFRYLKGQSKLGLWYPRDSSFDLEAFLDSDYTGASLDRKSTTGVCQFLGKRLISWQCEKQIVVANLTTEADYVFAANCYGHVDDISNEFGVKTGSCKVNAARQDLVLLGEREDDRVVKAATTATSLEAEQESGNINKTRSTTTLNEPSPQGTSSGSGPKCQDTTLGDADAQTRFETASKQSHNLPLSEVNTSGSREDNMEHQDDLTDFVPLTPHDLPLSGDRSRLGDQKVTKESKKIGKEAKGKNSKDESLQAIENVKGDTVNVGGAINTATTGVSASSSSVTSTGVSISTAEPKTPPTTTITTFEDEDLTIAQTLLKMRSKKAKEKGVAFRDVKESIRPIIILLTIDPKDKGKGIMQEPKKPPKNPRKAHIQLDEELAKRMHEEEMVKLKRRQSEIAAEEEASKAAINQEFDDIQAMIEADEQMALRLQSEQQKQLTIEEKSRMLVEMIAERKRLFAAQRAAEQRSKPPRKAKMRNRMCTYLKNQASYKHNQLKGRSYDDIQKLFDKAYKQEEKRRFKTITKVTKEAKSDEGQESAKDEQEKEELRLCLKIVQDEDRVINSETLAMKSLFVDWETQLLGSELQGEDLSYWKITRADGSFRFYKVFSIILEEFDREDLFDLHRLVMKRFKSVALEAYDLILWGDLKTMIEPNEEDKVWKNQQE
nr:putative ribonuclease H-like domain-containing protein [Tanacetum cinerariifolium]